MPGCGLPTVLSGAQPECILPRVFCNTAWVSLPETTFVPSKGSARYQFGLQLPGLHAMPANKTTERPLPVWSRALAAYSTLHGGQVSPALHMTAIYNQRLLLLLYSCQDLLGRLTQTFLVCFVPVVMKTAGTSRRHQSLVSLRHCLLPPSPPLPCPNSAIASHLP